MLHRDRSHLQQLATPTADKHRFYIHVVQTNKFHKHYLTSSSSSAKQIKLESEVYLAMALQETQYRNMCGRFRRRSK